MKKGFYKRSIYLFIYLLIYLFILSYFFRGEGVGGFIARSTTRSSLLRVEPGYELKFTAKSLVLFFPVPVVPLVTALFAVYRENGGHFEVKRQEAGSIVL